MSYLVPIAAVLVVLRALKYAWDESPSIRMDQRLANAMKGDGMVRNDELSNEANERRELEIRESMRKMGYNDKEIDRAFKDVEKLSKK